MSTIYKGQECLSLDQWEKHLHDFTRKSAKEIPSLIKSRQKKIDNYELSI